MNKQPLIPLFTACFVAAFLFTAVWSAIAISPTDWSEETLVSIPGSIFGFPIHPSLSNDGTRAVGLLPYSGDGDDNRHIVVSEKVGGIWQEQVVVATNGWYSHDSYQHMARRTYPVISGDGQTIVYVGHTGENFVFAPYMITRQPNGWSTPTRIPTGLADVHYWISLSQDGHTLALGSYVYLGTSHIYVLTRSGDSWSEPVRVTLDEYPLAGGGRPSLSADGHKLAYIQNRHLIFTEWIEGSWLPPQQLTNYQRHESVEFPQMSGDGQAIYYWLVQHVSEGGAMVRKSQDLYVMRRSGGEWHEPEKVTDAPTIPSYGTDSPAAANETATRFIYTRPITRPDPILGQIIYAAQLEWSEWSEEGWQTTTLVPVGHGGMNRWPRLSPDGLILLFKGGTRYTEDSQEMSGMLLQISTAVPPPVRPLPVSVTGEIGSEGGTLFSEIDQTRYTFPPGTFSDSVSVTHTFQPPAVAPAGLTTSGHGFVVTAVYSDTNQPAQPTLPVTVTIDYGLTGHGPAIPGTLQLWRLEGSAWLPLPGVDDPAGRQLTAQISHFSQFAVFGETYQTFLPVVVR